MSPKPSLESRQKIYRSLCYVLSERIDQVGWEEFTPADWELFAQMAEREGVAPLMYWAFKRINVETLHVPPGVFAALKNSYYNTLAQNTLMYQELERILRALDEAGIEVIVLKGAALAVTVYEDIGLRPMGDLDLLVKREDLENSLSRIISLGFHVASKERIAGLNRFIGHQIPLMSDQQLNLAVELHWSLIKGDEDWRSPPVHRFWNQGMQPEVKDEVGLSGDGWFVLNQVTHVLYLMAHLTLQHGLAQSRLLWFYDIYKLICHNNEIDWDQLLNNAKEFDWSGVLFTAINEIQLRFDLEFPMNKYETFDKEPRSGYLIQEKARKPRTRVIREWRNMYTLNWRARALLLFSILFPSPTHIKRQYLPRVSWLWPFYYLYRWLDILSDGLYTLAIILWHRVTKGTVTRL